MLSNSRIFDNLEIDEKKVYCIITLYGPRPTPEISICSDDDGEYYLCVKIREFNAYDMPDHHYLVIRSKFSDIHVLLSGQVSLQKLFQQSKYFWSYVPNKFYAPKYLTDTYFHMIENKLPATYFNYAEHSKAVSEFFQSAELIVRDLAGLGKEQKRTGVS